MAKENETVIIKAALTILNKLTTSLKDSELTEILRLTLLRQPT